MVKGNSYGPMVEFTKVYGPMVSSMVKVYIVTTLGSNAKGFGKMENALSG